MHDDGSIEEHHRPRNPALTITPDPTLSLGTAKSEISAAVKKFNEADRKDGLRDMCEIVERLTEEVGVVACRKSWLKIPELEFQKRIGQDKSTNWLVQKYTPARMYLW